MRPLLAPGLHVLRRGDDRIQVGLDRDHAVVLPGTDAVRRSLRSLERGELTSTTEVPATLQALLAAPVPKRTGKVAVVGFGHPSHAALVPRVRDLAGAAGWSPGRTTADVVVAVGVGEPDRELVDPWTQAGTPHVLVRLVEGYAVIGPFVVPGRTACLRCTDAAASDADPSWPLLLRQYTSAAARDRRDGATEPVDPVLADLACAWAVRDVTSYLSGIRPSTWSTSVRLDPFLHALGTTEWLRHPACGCTWTMDG